MGDDLRRENDLPDVGHTTQRAPFMVLTDLKQTLDFAGKRWPQLPAETVVS
jgi:hypothetical protein